MARKQIGGMHMQIAPRDSGPTSHALLSLDQPLSNLHLRVLCAFPDYYLWCRNCLAL
jgi:hypothetical protein